MSWYHRRERWDQVHTVAAGARGTAADVVTHSIASVLALGPGAVVVDAGCGDGRLLRMLPPSVLGVGADLSRRALCRARALDMRACWLQADAGQLPVRDDAADAVVLQSVWWAVPDVDAMTAEAARVLRPGGVVVVQVWQPAPSCQLITLGAAAVARVRPALIRPAGSRGPFDVTEREVTTTLAAAGLTMPVWHRFDHVWPLRGRADYLAELAALAPTAHAEYVAAPAGDRARIDRLLDRLLSEVAARGGTGLGLAWRLAVAMSR